MYFSNRKKRLFIFVVLNISFCVFYSYDSVADISVVLYGNEGKENYNNNDNKDVQKNDVDQKSGFGISRNKVKLNIGGLVDFQYYYTHSYEKAYEKIILPNGLVSSPAMYNTTSLYNEGGNSLNVLGKIDINPEFIRYKPKELQGEGINPIAIKVGAKISHPFMNAARNIDLKLAPQEYIYVDTDYFHFEFGEVASAAAKMKVDASKLASGNGGVFGTWWRYVNLPVYNNNLTGDGFLALNGMSPIYMLYPSLPNEAGFTAQRGIIGQSILADKMFIKSGGFYTGVSYGTNAQPYPTQGAFSNKLSLYSKRIYGFKFGISYSPNTANSGYITKLLNGNLNEYNNILGGYVKNYVAVALDYRKQWDKYGIGLALSATYEHGNPSNISYIYNNNYKQYELLLSNSIYYKRNDLNAWNIGAQFVWKNYSIVYSYGDWGKSLLSQYMATKTGEYQIANQGRKSYYHTVGIGANYGPVKIGATYMRSNYAGNILDAWSIGTDFKMISKKYMRVQPYFEYVGYFFHTPKNILKVGDLIRYKAIQNKGFVLTAGMRIIF